VDLLALSSGVAKPFPLRHITNELARRRSAITIESDSSVLELIGPARNYTTELLVPHDTLPALGMRPMSTGPISQVTTEATTGTNVVSIGWLGSQSDVAAALASLMPLLGDTGAVYFVEPSLSSGIRRHLAMRLARWAYRRSGWWPNHDMPALMRQAGLVVTDLERFFIPNVGLASSSWVQGRATKANTDEQLVPEHAVKTAVTGSKTSEG